MLTEIVKNFKLSLWLKDSRHENESKAPKNDSKPNTNSGIRHKSTSLQDLVMFDNAGKQKSMTSKF